MNEQKKLEDYSDIELAELNGQQFELAMNVQNNLRNISQEIQNRKNKPKEVIKNG